MDPTTKAASCLMALALAAAATVPAAATANAQPRHAEGFAQVADLDGTALYERDRRDAQKDRWRDVREALAGFGSATPAPAGEPPSEPVAGAEPKCSAQAPRTGSGGLTREGGVNEYGGRTETWYSSQVARHADTDEWTADPEGFYRDSQGRYVVAASDMPQGTVFDTSKGQAIVLDSGCAVGVTDFYVNWN